MSRWTDREAEGERERVRLDWGETASQPWPRIAGVLFNDRLSRDGNLPACAPSPLLRLPLYYVSLPPTLFTTAAAALTALLPPIFRSL